MNAALSLYGLILFLLPIVGAVAYRRRLRRGHWSRVKAWWRYTGLVFAPVVLYAAFFAGLVGLEELTGASLVTEGLARTFLLAVGLGLLVALIAMLAFGVVLRLSSRPDEQQSSE